MKTDLSDEVSVVGLTAILGEHPFLSGPAPWPTHRTHEPERLELTLRYKGAQYRALLAGTKEAAADLHIHTDEPWQGWAARIMPDKAGWKIDYFSIPDFESEPGTVFPALEDALIAIAEVLPAVNSEEQRLKAREDLRRLLSKREQSDEADPG